MTIVSPVGCSLTTARPLERLEHVLAFLHRGVLQVFYLEPAVLSINADAPLGRQTDAPVRETQSALLSNREKEIVRLVAEGMSNQSIAER